MTATRSGILARGPWTAEQIEARWLDEAYDPPGDLHRLADAAVRGLRERGSPAHDGMATRLAGWREESDRLVLDLQPSRWALRLVEGNACDSLTALCVVRARDGRWLAGRRAGWVSTWANRWALGAGGAVDLGESPAGTLTRELHGGVAADRRSGEHRGARRLGGRHGDARGDGHRARFGHARARPRA